MATITEDYVSFEIAKLLKEKGFDEECLRFYMPNGYGVWKYEHYHDFDISDRIECPTLQMAMKWLREVYDIKVNIFYSNPNYAIEYFEPNTQTGVGKFVFIGDDYKSFEQACEEAIKYCLEDLI